jgi:hypothetical protein
LYLRKGHFALADFGISKIKNGTLTMGANINQSSLAKFGKKKNKNNFIFLIKFIMIKK